MAVVVVMLLLVTVTALGAWQLFHQLHARVAADTLNNNIDRLLAAIQKNGDQMFLDTTRLDVGYKRPFSGQYFVIQLGAQRWRSRSLWDVDLALTDTASGSELFAVQGPGEQQLLALTKKLKRFGQPVVITAANDFSDLRAEANRALALLVGFWSIALIATLLLLNHWIRRALQPMEVARRQVAEIQAGSRQLLDESVPAELLPLIRQVNLLLEETRRALLRSRNALSNLGHALKTPLAVLSTLVSREEIRKDADLYSGLCEQLNQIEGRIRRELGQAQNANSAAFNTAFVPARDIAMLVKTLEQAHNRQLRVDCDFQVKTLPFEREDMLELVGNILDNGFKWAKSEIAVTIVEQDNQWIITVGDDGDGIVEEPMRHQVLARGQRLDETVAGQGLGLAIAADIVDAYKGDLRLAQSPLGGLEVKIIFPAPGLKKATIN
jgi:signal transduction histidine kinase